MRGEKWRIEEEFGKPLDEVLLGLLNSGMMAKEVAERLRVTPTTVSTWCRIYGITRRVVWVKEEK